MLVGVDLKKDANVLHARTTMRRVSPADFNLNLLARITASSAATSTCRRFGHYAFYNPMAGRIEMRLVAREAHAVNIGNTASLPSRRIDSHRELLQVFGQEFETLAANAGFKPAKLWTDARRWFGCWTASGLSAPMRLVGRWPMVARCGRRFPSPAVPSAPSPVGRGDSESTATRWPASRDPGGDAAHADLGFLVVRRQPGAASLEVRARAGGKLVIVFWCAARGRCAWRSRAAARSRPPAGTICPRGDVEGSRAPITCTTRIAERPEDGALDVDDLVVVAHREVGVSPVWECSSRMSGSAARAR